MGSSFTRFRDKGFWCRDTLLQLWLRVLCLHMDHNVHVAGWERELRDKWLFASSGESCCPTALLDEFLTDGDRVSYILRVSERSIQSLRAFGPYVPAAFLSALLGGGKCEADWPVEWFERIANTFAMLLRGELITDIRTSPTLPAIRQGQSWDEIEQIRKA